MYTRFQLCFRYRPSSHRPPCQCRALFSLAPSRDILIVLDRSPHHFDHTTLEIMAHTQHEHLARDRPCWDRDPICPIVLAEAQSF